MNHEKIPKKIKKITLRYVNLTVVKPIAGRKFGYARISPTLLNLLNEEKLFKVIIEEED